MEALEAKYKVVIKFANQIQYSLILRTLLSASIKFSRIMIVESYYGLSLISDKVMVEDLKSFK